MFEKNVRSGAELAALHDKSARASDDGGEYAEGVYDTLQWLLGYSDDVPLWDYPATDLEGIEAT